MLSFPFHRRGNRGHRAATSKEPGPRMQDPSSGACSAPNHRTPASQQCRKRDAAPPGTLDAKIRWLKASPFLPKMISTQNYFPGPIIKDTFSHFSLRTLTSSTVFLRSYSGVQFLEMREETRQGEIRELPSPWMRDPGWGKATEVSGWKRGTLRNY